MASWLTTNSNMLDCHLPDALTCLMQTLTVNDGEHAIRLHNGLSHGSPAHHTSSNTRSTLCASATARGVAVQQRSTRDDHGITAQSSVPHRQAWTQTIPPAATRPAVRSRAHNSAYWASHAHPASLEAQLRRAQSSAELRCRRCMMESAAHRIKQRLVERSSLSSAQLQVAQLSSSGGCMARHAAGVELARCSCLHAAVRVKLSRAQQR